MGSFTVKRALTGLISVLAATSLFAADALVDDHEDGSNANEFENYWYYYDDNAGVKEDDRPTAGEGTKASVVDVPFTEKNREAFGNKSDIYKVKDYTFTIKEEAGNKYATLPFTFGEKWKASWCTKEACAYPFVGLGAMLAPDGKAINLTGATAVTFKLRSHTGKLTVWFKIETSDIGEDSTFAFYQAKCEVAAGAWTDYTIAIPADIAQPAWATGEREAAFSQNLVSKIAWGVSMEDNTLVTKDTLDLDQVVIKGYTYVSPTVWTKIAAAEPTDGLIGNFESAPKNATPFSTYWYAYNDKDIGGTSEVLQGATKVADTGRLQLDLEMAGSGVNNSFGAYLKATNGAVVKQTTATGTVDVQGFVGIGFNCYDSINSSYFDATTGKKGVKDFASSTSSIYFNYLCTGDFKYLTLEISDKNDVGDALAPTRKDSRGSGIVYYRNFPNTAGAWSSVEIPFDSLIVHSDWKGYTAIPFDKKNIAKIQWKTQNAQGKSGMIAVDNVRLPGLKVGIAGRSISRTASASAFSAAYLNGAISINWKNAPSVSGKINVLNTKGAVVASVPVGAAKISAATLPAGMYFVELSGTDMSGKAVSQKTALTIVK